VTVPTKKTENLSLEVEAPLVYRATPVPPPPAPAPDAQKLPLAYSAAPQPIPTAEVSPPLPAPTTPAKKPHHGFFGKIKGLMVSIFR